MFESKRKDTSVHFHNAVNLADKPEAGKEPNGSWKDTKRNSGYGEL